MYVAEDGVPGLLEALRPVAVGADDILRRERDTRSEANLKLCHAKAESQQARCVVHNFVRWLIVQDLTVPNFRSASVRTRWQRLRRKKRGSCPLLSLLSKSGCDGNCSFIGAAARFNLRKQGDDCCVFAL